MFIEKSTLCQALCSILYHILFHLITTSLLGKNNFPYFVDGKTRTQILNRECLRSNQ